MLSLYCNFEEREKEGIELANEKIEVLKKDLENANMVLLSRMHRLHLNTIMWMRL